MELGEGSSSFCQTSISLNSPTQDSIVAWTGMIASALLSLYSFLFLASKQLQFHAKPTNLILPRNEDE
jgi:hypothetical protein